MKKYDFLYFLYWITFFFLLKQRHQQKIEIISIFKIGGLLKKKKNSVYIISKSMIKN